MIILFKGGVIKIIRSWLCLIVLTLVLSGCVSHNQPQASGTINPATTSSSSASWAYPFVIVNGVSYGLSNNDTEITKSEVGNKIGVVKRNVENMDSSSTKYVQKNFDSNTLKKGTSLYEYKKDKTAIVYEKNSKFYLAKKVNK